MNDGTGAMVRYSGGASHLVPRCQPVHDPRGAAGPLPYGTRRRRRTNEKAGEAEAQVEAGEAQVEAHKAFPDYGPVMVTRRQRQAKAEAKKTKEEGQ